MVHIYLTIYKFDPPKPEIPIRSFDNYNEKKSGYVIEMNSAQILCVNKKPTRYYGVATAYAYIPTKGAFERMVQSLNTPVLKCGMS